MVINLNMQPTKYTYQEGGNMLGMESIHNVKTT
jgi:hypothetical protein